MTDDEFWKVVDKSRKGAAADPDGSTGAGRAYWPDVARLLRDSYRSLKGALDGVQDTADVPEVPVSDPRVAAR